MNQSAYSALDPSAARFMTFGQILDRIYRLMRTHLRLLLSVAAVPSGILIPIFALAAIPFFFVVKQSEATKSPPHGLPLFFMLVGMGASYLLMLGMIALYMAAASYAAMQANEGFSASFREAYAVAWRRVGRHLWLMVLMCLYVLAPMAIIGSAAGSTALLLRHSAASAVSPAAAFALFPVFILLYVGMAVYSILIMLRFALAYPVCVSEGLTAWNSLQRSAQLTRGAKGRIFLAMLVIYAATYVVNMVLIVGLMMLGMLGAFAASLAHVAAGSPAFFILIGLAALGYLIVIAVSSMISYATFTTALAVIYHDQRRRKDGSMPESGMIPVS